MSYLLKNPEVFMLSSSMTDYKEKDKALPNFNSYEIKYYSFEDMLIKNTIGTPTTVIVKKDVFQKVEMFDINKLDIRPGYLIYEGQGYSYVNGEIEEYNGTSEENIELLKTAGFYSDEDYAAALAEARYRENAKKQYVSSLK